MAKKDINPKRELDNIIETLIDPLAIKLTKSVKWLRLNKLSKTSTELYPVAIIGQGKPILLLHGFDSCFLEFRRLVPHLKERYQLIIPDMYGFGFCPRPEHNKYGLEAILYHLNEHIYHSLLSHL